MGNDERIIFGEGKERPITKDEHNRINSTPEQQKELLKSLVAWSAKAFYNLNHFGYGTDLSDDTDTTKLIFCKTIPNPDWDRAIDDGDEEVSVDVIDMHSQLYDSTTWGKPSSITTATQTPVMHSGIEPTNRIDFDSLSVESYRAPKTQNQGGPNYPHSPQPKEGPAIERLCSVD